MLRSLIAATGFVGLTLPALVIAQDYPSKPVRIITGAAGGGSDFTARLIAQGIAGPLGQPVVVDNRGSSLVSSEAVAKSAPDGYTLLLTGSTLWVFPLLNAKAPYAISDFAPISLVSTETLIVAVHPSLPVRSIKELIALAKSKSGELIVASGSPGSPADLAGHLFKSMAGVNILSVPYKSSVGAVAGVAGGEVHMTIYDAALITPYAKAGKLRPLAVTSSEPSALAPGLPTVASAGLPGYESVGMNGILAPAKTPSTIVNRLGQEIIRMLAQPEAKERLLNAQADAVGSTPERFAAAIKSDIERKTRIIRDAGIKIQ